MKNDLKIILKFQETTGIRVQSDKRWLKLDANKTVKEATIAVIERASKFQLYLQQVLNQCHVRKIMWSTA